MFSVNVERPPPLLMHFHHTTFKFLICDLTETPPHVSVHVLHRKPWRNMSNCYTLPEM